MHLFTFKLLMFNYNIFKIEKLPSSLGLLVCGKPHNWKSCIHSPHKLPALYTS